MDEGHVGSWDDDDEVEDYLANTWEGEFGAIELSRSSAGHPGVRVAWGFLQAADSSTSLSAAYIEQGSAVRWKCRAHTSLTCNNKLP